MRLVLVHGINQQGKDAEALKTQWLCFLADQGLGKPGAFDAIDVVMPFYGDALKEWADGTGANAISQGPGGAPNLDEAQFLTQLLRDPTYLQCSGG